MRSSTVKSLIVLLGLFMLTSCGGGGGGAGGVLPGGGGAPGAGTPSGTVNLGTVGLPVSKTGAVAEMGNNYYTFRTDATAGKYSFTLKNTSTWLELTLYSDSGFSVAKLSCDNIWVGGDIICATQSPHLAPSTDYYVKVSSWSLSADTYTLGVSRVDSEGTPGSPILLTVGVPHDGSIDASHSSYYYFKTTSAGEYAISLSPIAGLGNNLLSVDVYETGFAGTLIKSCTQGFDPVCTVNGLAAGTFYYVKANEKSGVASIYTIEVAKGSSEGSAAGPVSLTYDGVNHAGAVDGNGSSYYTFTPTNTGDSIITLSTTTAVLLITVYSDPAFTSGQMAWIFLTGGETCTVSNVNQGVPYYPMITNYDAAGAAYMVNVKAGGNEGTIAHPIDVTGQNHTGTVDAGGTSYFTFTTTTSGSYLITINTALPSTYWSLYQDQNYSNSIYSISHPNNSGTLVDSKCGNACVTYYYQYGGKTYYNLDAGTTYYLTVKNDSAVSGTFTLTEATGADNSEGSMNDPMILTAGTPWPGRVGADISSFYSFTPSLSTNYLVRLTNVQTPGDWGMTLDFFANAGYAPSLGYCGTHSYYTAYNGDVVCPITNFISSPSLTAGTPFYVELTNDDFYTANTYSINVTPFAPSLGCNSGGATCYTFEPGIPGNFVNNPTTLPYASASGWALDTGSTGTGAQSFMSTKPKGNVTTYRSCFSFNASNVKWIGYSAKVVTTGYDSLDMYVYNSTGTTLVDTPTLVYGNAAWQRKVYIPPQNADLLYEWCYEKQSNATGDAAWVDDIELN